MSLKEYVQSKHELNGKGIKESECKSIISDIVRNLWKWHKTGHVHGDINPDHIMYNDKTKKWIPIGYNHKYYIGTEKYMNSNEVYGSIEWSPPELDPNLKYRFSWNQDMSNLLCFENDIWAIGLLILYILFGEQPLKQNKHLKGYTEATDKEYWVHAYDWRRVALMKTVNQDCTINKDPRTGEYWLKNHLVSLYYEEKISSELFDLLHNFVLIFDPKKRANCEVLLNHKWF